MSKLLNNLNNQLKNEFKTEAEDCIKIYNKLLEINDGHVWNSQWDALVDVKFKGFPNSRRIYTPSKIGYIFINGIKQFKMANKYRYEAVIQQDFGNGFEDVDKYETKSDGTPIEMYRERSVKDGVTTRAMSMLRHDLREYKLLGYTTRVINRRTKI